jgi:putative membrane protein
MQKLLALSSALAFVSLLACGEKPQPAAPDPVPTTPEPAASAPVDLPPADAGAPTASPTPAETPLTDEQIAKVTWTVHQGEIDAGKMAATSAKDAKVKKFASMMVKHHGDQQKKEEALAKKLKVTPADSPVSTQVASQNESVASTLKGLKGADFDKAYIDSQIKGHQDALDTIDKKLLPAVKNEEMKAGITAFRPAVEQHLKEAKDIQAGLK